MSTPSQARPSIRREWAPSSHLVLHSSNTKTSFSFAPIATTDNPDAEFFCELRVFGNDPANPLGIFGNRSIQSFDNWVVNSDEIVKACGLSELCHYVECYTGSADFLPPTDTIVIPVFAHYRSLESGFSGHLTSSYIYGSSRFTRRGRCFYENIPGVRVDREFKPFVYTINPLIRPTRIAIMLVSGGETIYQGEWEKVRAKAVHRWDCPSELIAEGQACCLVVQSEEKTSSFTGLVHKPSGNTASFDHMHPFFSV
jgi:hypothetical protein